MSDSGLILFSSCGSCTGEEFLYCKLIFGLIITEGLLLVGVSSLEFEKTFSEK